MSPENTVKAAPAETRNGSQNDDQLGQAINEVNGTAAAPAQGNRTVVASWPRNGRETIQVALDRYQGRDVIDVRVWWTDTNGELKPGRSGLTVSVRHLPNLAAALTEALAVAEQRGLLDERPTC